MDFAAQLLGAVLPSLVVGIFMAVWNAKQKRFTDAEKQRELDRLRAEALEISLLVATAQLSYAVAIAIKRGAANGEVEEGIEQYQRAMSKVREFEREQLARNITQQ